MIVTLYNYNKRENSTAIPSAGLDLDSVILKEPTNVLNPVLRITPSVMGSATIAPVVYNYAHIQKFQRYYFIDNWEYVGGCWECSLSVDVLGSWRGIIGTTSAYVERAESAYDGNIIDMMFPATTDYDVVNSPLASSWYSVAPSGGTFVLGCINHATRGKVGAITYYALTSAQLGNLLNYLFSSNIFNSSSITEIGEGLFKSLFNPFQYIVSCLYFPLGLEAFGSESTTIEVGYWDTLLPGTLVTSLSEQTFITGAFPSHPQAETRGDFLNYAPYAYYTLHIPPFGAVSIDSSFRRYGDYIRCQVFIDHITGQAICRPGISRSAQGGTVSIWAGEVTGMFGVPIQLAQIASDYIGALGSAASTGGIAGLISGAVQTAVSAFAPSVNSTGVNGSFIMSVAPAGLISNFAKITGASDSILGRPLMQQRTISTLSGYIKCRDVHISAPCFREEKGRIEQYMMEGFYYE